MASGALCVVLNSMLFADEELVSVRETQWERNGSVTRNSPPATQSPWLTQTRDCTPFQNAGLDERMCLRCCAL
jgi:hypothetical protein